MFTLIGARVLSSGDIVSVVTRCWCSQTRYFGDEHVYAWRAVVTGTITDIAATEPSFVVERFEVAGDRLEVTGHWSGLRGRRFVRPVLWLHRGDARRRLVAVLEHKPWAVDDGDPWIAAFAWKGGKLDADRAELEVGREWVVELPVPGAQRRAEAAGPAAPRPPSELDRAREQLWRARSAASSSRARAAPADHQGTRPRPRRGPSRRAPNGERLVNDEYRQREHALAAAEEATARARDAETAPTSPSASSPPPARATRSSSSASPPTEAPRGRDSATGSRERDAARARPAPRRLTEANAGRPSPRRARRAGASATSRERRGRRRARPAPRRAPRRAAGEERERLAPSWPTPRACRPAAAAATARARPSGSSASWRPRGRTASGSRASCPRRAGGRERVEAELSARAPTASGRARARR